MERAKISINFDKVREKARKRGEYPGKLIRDIINYDTAPIGAGCGSCDLYVTPTVAGKNYKMCSLIGVDITDPYCLTDNNHKCKMHSQEWNKSIGE